MGQIYYSDDASGGQFGAATKGAITRSFVATSATMLTTTGAAGFLVGDIILLAPIPAGVVLDNYEVNIPEWDTGSAVSYDLGDNVVLSGATNGTVGTGFTTAAIGTSQTITAAASTSSFTATNGALMINGVLFGYASLSGSTFVTAYASVPGVVIPKGALIQQAGNFSAYQAIAVVQAGGAIVLLPWGSVSATTVATTTAVPSALPAVYGTPFNTTGTPNPAVPAQIGQTWFALKIHASPTTYNAPSVPITGFIQYHER
jgi:hypothetical protein